MGCRNILKDLKRARHLKNFYFEWRECQFMSFVEFPGLNQILHKIGFFQNTNLNSFKAIKITNTAMKTQKNYSTLQNVCLNLSLHQDISRTQLPEIFEGLIRLGAFQNLALEFRDCQQLSQLEMPIISENLGKMLSLRSIRLNFTDSYLLQESGLFALSRGLKSFTKLENLHIIFPSVSSFNETALKNLGNTLTEIQSLKKISLRFYNGFLKPSTFDLERTFSRSSPKIDLDIQWINVERVPFGKISSFLEMAQ